MVPIMNNLPMNTIIYRGQVMTQPFFLSVTP